MSEWFKTGGDRIRMYSTHTPCGSFVDEREMRATMLVKRSKIV